MSHFCLAVDVDKGKGEGRKGVVRKRVDCSLRRRFQTHPGSQSEARGHDDAVCWQTPSVETISVDLFPFLEGEGEEETEEEEGKREVCQVK